MKPLTVDTGICIAAFSKTPSDQAHLRAITDELGKYGIASLRRLVRPLMPQRKSKSTGYLPEMLYVRPADATMAMSVYTKTKKRLARNNKNAS